ncbi:diphosphomevalonate decarboxylase [Streptomyces celluloflavus]|uniref:diphosphomevalonate decarboxylase n=1 Tax=Streptomyces celluloflavus TaxID=58344 RepID=UPI003685009F
MIWATANSNLALVKYWGKAREADNQPAAPSLSVTLDGLTSLACVEERRTEAADRVAWYPPGPTGGLADFVARGRSELGIRHALDVVITSRFPVAAGLASSASAYAALTTALVAFAPEPVSAARIAALARRGSGSACRSLVAGFVEWRAGDEAGAVVQVAPPEHWPLTILVAVTSAEVKSVSSREGMRRTRATSPFYRSWLTAGAADFGVVREAVRLRDLPLLGPAIERNALRMHAAALGADPPLLYWEAATLSVIREVWGLRRSGVPAFFTIDAGPQVKVLCAPADADHVAQALAAVTGVSCVLRSRPGGAPRILSGPPDWAPDPVPRMPPVGGGGAGA